MAHFRLPAVAGRILINPSRLFLEIGSLFDFMRIYDGVKNLYEVVHEWARFYSKLFLLQTGENGPKMDQNVEFIRSLESIENFGHYVS